MNRSQVEHVLRAAAAITQENSFFVVGSQAILMAFPNAPDELLLSRELDLFPALHPEKADLIDGAIGAMSSFDQTFGYHADGVGPETAVMPPDWRSREQFFYVGDVTVICPEVHDLAVSKCVAGRDKDAEFIRVLLLHKMITLPLLLKRIQSLPIEYQPSRVSAWASRRAQEAGNA